MKTFCMHSTFGSINTFCKILVLYKLYLQPWMKSEEHICVLLHVKSIFLKILNSIDILFVFFFTNIHVCSFPYRLFDRSLSQPFLMFNRYFFSYFLFVFVCLYVKMGGSYRFAWTAYIFGISSSMWKKN